MNLVHVLTSLGGLDTPKIRDGKSGALCRDVDALKVATAFVRTSTRHVLFVALKAATPVFLNCATIRTGAPKVGVVTVDQS